MSRHLGEIRQNGFVVRDIRAAVQHLSEALGVGPLLHLEEAPHSDLRCAGSRSNARAAMAFAHAGRLQIELIQPLDDEPSMYRDFLQAGREGLQRPGYLIDGYDGVIAAGLERGWTIGQNGSMDGVRFCYFATEAHFGTVVEVIESTDGARAFHATLEERLGSWDGRDPIRHR